MANGLDDLEKLRALLGALEGAGVAEASLYPNGSLQRVRFAPAQPLALPEASGVDVTDEDEALSASGYRLVRNRQWPPAGES